MHTKNLHNTSNNDSGTAQLQTLMGQKFINSACHNDQL